MAVEIYVDGSCSKNPGMGGIGVVINKNNEQFCFSRFSLNLTTNNRMEISSVIFALFSIESCGILKNEPINLFTDSKYVILGWKFLEIWRNLNWTTVGKTEVLNKDLWQLIYEIRKEYKNLTIRWIPRELNSQADYLANIATFQKLNLTIKTTSI